MKDNISETAKLPCFMNNIQFAFISGHMCEFVDKTVNFFRCVICFYMAASIFC